MTTLMAEICGASYRPLPQDIRFVCGLIMGHSGYHADLGMSRIWEGEDRTKWPQPKGASVKNMISAAHLEHILNATVKLCEVKLNLPASKDEHHSVNPATVFGSLLREFYAVTEG